MGWPSFFGAISTDGFATQGIGAFVSAVGAMFAASLFKNIFEEFAWRGYLTPRFEGEKVAPTNEGILLSILMGLAGLAMMRYRLKKSRTA